MIELITVENNLGYINRNDVSEITCFKKLVKRVKKCEGDNDGRLKLLNQKELAYINGMAKFVITNSIYAGFSRKEKHVKLCINLGMPDGWKPDKLVEECITTYIDIIENYIPSSALLGSLNKALMTSKNVVDSLLEQMNGLNNNAQQKLTDAITGGADDEIISKLSLTTDLLAKNVERILSIASKLPKTLTNIKALEKEVKIETSKAKQIRGNKRKYNREDPR